MLGSMKNRYRTSWRRPSKRSSSVAAPSVPSNRYVFSTATIGIRRRQAASASRARVTSFSFPSSAARGTSHSSGPTISGFGVPIRSTPRFVAMMAAPTPPRRTAFGTRRQLHRLAGHVGLPSTNRGAPPARRSEASTGTATRTAVLFAASVQDERHLEMDAEAGDLPIANQNLLLLHPGPLDVAHRLACLRDRVANRGLEALAARRCQLDRLGNAHGVSSS